MLGIAPRSRDSARACTAAMLARPRAEVSDRAMSDGASRVTMTSVVGTGPAATPLPAKDATAAADAQKMARRLRLRMRGLEPPRPKGHTDLNRARLPIPPHPLARPVYRAPSYSRFAPVPCPRGYGEAP